MILTIAEDDKTILLNNITIKEGMDREIRRLYELYSSANLEYGYLIHGATNFYYTKPSNKIITDDNILLYDSHKWGNNGIKNNYGMTCYPVEYYTTWAKYTLFIISQLLGYKKESQIKLRKYFEGINSVNKNIGIVTNESFNLDKQIAKLDTILSNPQIALSLLENAYLDYSLFVNLLSNITITPQEIEKSLQEFFKVNGFVTEAKENTKLLKKAYEFSKLR